MDFESCTIFSKEIGVEAPEIVRTISGHTRKCGNSVSITKGLRASANGEGEALSVKGKGVGKSDGTAGTAGAFSATNGAGYSGIHVYRDERTQLVTRFTLDPNLPETETTSRSSAEVADTPAHRWAATPVMIGASENTSVQKQATRVLKRPLGPRCLFRLRLKIAADCDDGNSYIQDIQGDFVQRFEEPDGSVIFMFTNTEAKLIEPETVVVVDGAELPAEPAVSGEVVAEAFPEPEHHAIVIKEEDLPVVVREPETGALVEVEEQVNPDTGKLEVVERPIVGENGAGQAPEVVYVEENTQPGAPGISEDEIIVAGRRYVRSRNMKRRAYRKPAYGRRSYAPTTNMKFGPSTVFQKSRPSGKSGYGTKESKHGNYAKKENVDNYPAPGKMMRRYRGAKDRGVGAFGLDVDRKPDWKWGKTENIVLVSGVALLALIYGALYWKKKIQLEEARQETVAVASLASS